MRVALVWHLGFLASGHPRLKVLESPANQASILFVFRCRMWAIFGWNYNTPDRLKLSTRRSLLDPSVDVGVWHLNQAVADDVLACAEVFRNA